MTLHDDDPSHFEFALKFMYTLNYDISAIEEGSGKDNKSKRVEFAMGMCTIADKYDIKRLVQPAHDDLHQNVDAISDTKTLVAVIEAIYEMSPDFRVNFVKLILTTIFKAHHYFIGSHEFAELCKTCPEFAADFITSMERRQCVTCKKTLMFSVAHIELGNSCHGNCNYCSGATTTFVL